MNEVHEAGEAPIRVALVDDQQLVRGGFRMLIDSQPDLSVVAEAGTGVEAIEVLRRVPADVVLMDVRMPEMNGIEATRAILTLDRDAAGKLAGDLGGDLERDGVEQRRCAPIPRIIVLTTFDLDEYVLDAIHAGASGFLLKDAAPEELLRAIRQVHRGDAVISPAMTRRLIHHVQPLLANGGNGGPAVAPAPPGLAAVLATLTQREEEVLRLIAQGLSNLEIAATLFVSEATVKTHVTHILQKTASRDRVQAVVFAFESGLVTLA